MLRYTINLTDISYEALVDYLWNELNMSDTVLSKDIVRKLLLNIPGQYDIERLSGVNMNITFTVNNLSIRKMRIFLSELKMVIDNNEDKEVIDSRIADLNEFLNLEDNRKSLSLLLFLGYQLQIELFDNNIENIVCEPVHNLKRKEKNNKNIPKTTFLIQREYELLQPI